LGGPILEHQRAIDAAPPAAGDQAGQAAEAERQRVAAERKAARESGLMAQVGGNRTTPASPEPASAPAIRENEAVSPVWLDPDPDPRREPSQTDVLAGLGQADDINPHA